MCTHENDILLVLQQNVQFSQYFLWAQTFSMGNNSGEESTRKISELYNLESRCVFRKVVLFFVFDKFLVLKIQNIYA